MDITISTQHIDKIGFSCTLSQENIPINKYSNILKAQKLKRITEDTMKVMGWEEMWKECQNLGRNPWEKHTTCHDKWIKMKRGVYGRERDASLKPVEILFGRVT
jgi:hypothetical protein